MHTFLFQEADWDAEGEFFDQYGKEKAARGYTLVRHGPDKWEVEGEMTVEGPEPRSIRNNYTLEAWPPGGRATSWQSVDPALGLLFGMIGAVGDSLLSHFVSEDGEFSGVESLRMVDAGTYQSRGALFKRNRRISSWSMILKKTG